jgi:hypothetical protein
VKTGLENQSAGHVTTQSKQRRIVHIKWYLRETALLALLGIGSVVGMNAQTTGALSSGVYTLVVKSSGLSLDNEGATGASAVWQWVSNLGNSNQQWVIQPASNGAYSIVSQTSGLALSEGTATTDGAVTTQVPFASNVPGQQWQIASLGNGYYQFINAASGKALDNSGATANGGAVWQWDANENNPNQQWLVTPVQVGAKTPFTSYEAEIGTLSGGATVVALTSPPTTIFSSPELEASGHAYVNLASTGQQVSWVNTTSQAITAINVRYSIPDAPQGGGITSTLDLYVNGVFRQAIPVNSKQTWVYETANNYDGMNQNPADGNPHIFWDEVHTFITGAAVSPGSTISLRKDATNGADFYNIDVVDLETPPAPLAQPANSVSIASYGAVANNVAKDSTSAIQAAINAAQSSGMTVWIPAGTFYLNTTAGLTASGVTIQGAGMWYSTIYYNPTLPAASTNNVILATATTLKNFAIDGDAIDNSGAGGNAGAVNIKGDGWLIDSLWIQHEGAGIWADGSNGTAQNNRIDSVWADGINLNNGNGAQDNNSATNLTAFNNFVRGSGDDGLAINGGNGTGTVEPINITLVQNTSIAPWWANNIGIYGGSNDIVANNLAADSVKEFGISVGLFGGSGDNLESAWVEGNTVLRGGSYGNNGNIRYAGLGVGVSGSSGTVQNATLRGNTVVNAVFNGLEFVNGGSSIVIENNLVNAPGVNGFAIDAGAVGNASLLYNSAINISPGNSAYINDANSKSFTTSGTGNMGFSIP